MLSKALAHILANTLAVVWVETVANNQAKVEAKLLVDTLADRLAEVEVKTLGHKQAKIMLRHTV